MVVNIQLRKEFASVTDLLSRGTLDYYLLLQIEPTLYPVF